MIKSATLAADAAIQGIPCRAGMLVEFSEYGGDLQHCTLTQSTGVTAEIEEGQGGKSTEDLACGQKGTFGFGRSNAGSSNAVCSRKRR
jgi:hypothetical protein